MDAHTINDLVLTGLAITAGIAALALYGWVKLVQWWEARQARAEWAAAYRRDAARAAELNALEQAGDIARTMTRYYPNPEEFTWEWDRLREAGWVMDTQPMEIEDGYLMVTYHRPLGRRQIALG